MPTDFSLVSSVAAIVGAGNVFTGADVAPYVTDWRGRYHGSAQLVARPGTSAEVAAVVRLCFERAIPVLPQGGNTGLCGAATPDGSGRAVVIRLDRLNTIEQVDRLDGTVRVGAGAVLQNVQEAANAVGMFFPLSLGAEGSCQIGGNIATNAGGTAVLRYGPMRDLVLGLEVVLPDGTLCDWLTPLRKNNTGYDLKQLFVGAEGTLGLITAAVLKVFPRPAQTATAMMTLAGPEQALVLLESLRSSLGDRLSSFEIINRAQVEVVLTHVPGAGIPFAAPSPWYLLVEATDTLARYDLREALETLLHEALEAGTIGDAVVPASETQVAALWKLRHSVSEGNKRAGFGVTHDTAVPVRHQAAFVRAVERRLGAGFPDAPLLMVGHMGDGNIHVIQMLTPEQAATEDGCHEAAARINRIVDEETLRLHGAVSAEHGIGQTNKQRLLDGRGEADVALMRRVKAALDEKMLFNPGKVFDMTAAVSDGKH